MSAKVRPLQEVLDSLDQEGSPGVSNDERVALIFVLDYGPEVMQHFVADSIRARCTVSRQADPPDDWEPPRYYGNLGKLYSEYSGTLH